MYKETFQLFVIQQIISNLHAFQNPIAHLYLKKEMPTKNADRNCYIHNIYTQLTRNVLKLKYIQLIQSKI